MTAHKAAIRQENERAILIAAEEIFARYGFKGATTGRIAARAGIPKPNLHYYYPTKEALYRKVLEDVCTEWMAAASTFDHHDDPRQALTGYIQAKMDLARSRPHGSKVWANEIIHGAPVLKDYLETTLKPWFQHHVKRIQSWVANGEIEPVDPHTLLYMIWATTQHYADFSHQIEVLTGPASLSGEQFRSATREVTAIILNGIGVHRGQSDTANQGNTGAGSTFRDAP